MVVALVDPGERILALREPSVESEIDFRAGIFDSVQSFPALLKRISPPPSDAVTSFQGKGPEFNAELYKRG